jgi:Sulfotransferase family
MLRLMLASHSRLYIPPETWFLIPLVQRFSIDRPLSAGEIESAVAIMTSHHRWPDMKLDAQEFRSRVRRLRAPYLSDLAEVVYRSYGEATTGKPRWGDKTPPYIGIVPQLAAMYPQARFIHLVRDGRDVARSFQSRGWIGSDWLHDNGREWLRAMDAHWRLMRSELRERILLVYYEDLVRETEKTLRRICQFIGEVFEPQMLAWQGNVDAQVTAREHRQHNKLKLQIGAEGLARWKHELSARSTFLCEAFMAADLKRLGYELRYSGPLWAAAFALTRMATPVLLPAYAWTLRAGRRMAGLVRA